MSLLNVPYGPFPQVLSSLASSLSRPPASSTSMGRSRRENPCASARWRGLSGRMANPAPNTGFEPNFSNFFSCTDMEHTPINLTDSHHNFPCHDDATVISTKEDPEGSPHSGASGSKQSSLNVRTLKPLEADGRSCVGSYRPPGNWGGFGQRICCNNFFLFHSRKGKEIETQTLCIR